MNKIIKTALSAAILCLTLTIVSCSNEAKENDSTEQAKEINDEKINDGDAQKDADRVVEAYAGNLYEIKASENAAMRATSTDVKKLAGMIVVAHTKMNADIQALATRKNITLPTDINDEQRRKLEDLTQMNGLNYDREYTKQMKEKHEDAIKAYERTADKAEDPEIKQWASATIPEIRSHLEMVEVTDKTVKEMKEDDRDSKKEKNTWKGKSDLHDGKDDHHDDDGK